MAEKLARVIAVIGTDIGFRDAEGIAEAVQRPAMKFVATKTAG